jgi:hypothetical protein
MSVAEKNKLKTNSLILYKIIKNSKIYNINPLTTIKIPRYFFRK